MIYFVSNQTDTVLSSKFTIISVQESLDIMENWNIVQYDCETTGLDCHINKILLAQFGNKEGTIQIVVDCTTVDLIHYKDILETRKLIGANLKFDIKFLFNYNIIPSQIYDVIILDQYRYITYPTKAISNSLAAITLRYLDIPLDKSVRLTISEGKLTEEIILYAANDVKYLYQILKKQIDYLKEDDSLQAARIECDFVICTAYFEWCGVKLDVEKWENNIWDNDEKLKDITDKLNQFVLDFGDEKYLEYKYPDLFDLKEPGWRAKINWDSSKQVIPFLKDLGFETKVFDKKEKRYKDTASAKVIERQKDINLEFATLYKAYADISKERSTYGYTYINSINPNTGRIHTEYRQLGTSTGRLACGNNRINEDLAKLKKLPLKKSKGNEDRYCSYPQLQNLPRKKIIRESFIAEEGNVMISSDYSSQESRLLASLSGDEAMLHEYGPEGSKDMHALTAKMVYPELRNVSTKDIKLYHKDLRQKAKGPEFCFSFGGNWKTLVSTYGMDVDQAKEIDANYREGFSGVTKYQKQCSKFTASTGLIIICRETGHKAHVYKWEEWKKNQDNPEFWETYRNFKKANQQPPEYYFEHFNFKADMDKNAVNSTTQGLGSVIFKIFSYRFFKWIVKNNLFSKVKFCVPAHDEIVIECPKEIKDTVVEKLEYFMQHTGELFCHKLPMPVDSEIANHWVH